MGGRSWHNDKHKAIKDEVDGPRTLEVRGARGRGGGSSATLGPRVLARIWQACAGHTARRNRVKWNEWRSGGGRAVQ